MQKPIILPIGALTFSGQFRAACEQNSCGKFGRCHACPPDIGEARELIAHAKSFEYAAVITHIAKLQDPFDIEGMQAGAYEINSLVRQLAARLVSNGERVLMLGAGGCHFCRECSKPSGHPCRAPKKSVAGLEAYGVDAYRLAAACGTEYSAGEGGINFFGCLLH